MYLPFVSFYQGGSISNSELGHAVWFQKPCNVASIRQGRGFKLGRSQMFQRHMQYKHTHTRVQKDSIIIQIRPTSLKTKMPLGSPEVMLCYLNSHLGDYLQREKRKGMRKCKVLLSPYIQKLNRSFSYINLFKHCCLKVLLDLNPKI